MSSFLSKLQPVFGVGGKDDVAGDTVRPTPAIGSLLVGKRPRLLGGLFALFLLIYLVVRLGRFLTCQYSVPRIFYVHFNEPK